MGFKSHDPVKSSSTERYDIIGVDLDWFIILGSASSIFFGFLLKITVNPPSYFTLLDKTTLLASIYTIDGPFDLYDYRTKISLVVLLLDAPNLCVLRGIVLLKEYVHKSCTYIPPPVQRGNRKQTYLLYYMLDILFTFCVIIYDLCNNSRSNTIIILLIIRTGFYLT
jgi:hypothetical protein